MIRPLAAFALALLTGMGGSYDSTLEGPFIGLPTPLAAPSFEYTLNRPRDRTGKTLRLRKLFQEPNSITDDDKWFYRYDLDLPEIDDLGMPRGRAGMPRSFYGARLIRALYYDSTQFYFYADRHWEARFLVAMDPKTSWSRYVLDFKLWQHPPGTEPGDQGFTEMDTRWAVEEHGILYVSHCHRTFAASSHGLNAYITAIDLTDFSIIWRSEPLVSNTHNFELYGDFIVTGYGFSDEPDFLYVLDKATGEKVGRYPVKTGPDYVIRRNDSLFVRTYDTDYIYAIEEGD